MKIYINLPFIFVLVVWTEGPTEFVVTTQKCFIFKMSLSVGRDKLNTISELWWNLKVQKHLFSSKYFH